MSGTGAWRFASAPGRKKTRAVLPYGPLKETSAFVRARKAASGFLWCARPSKRELLVEEEIKQFRCLRFVGSFVKSLVFLNKKKKTKLTIFICHVAQEKCSTKNDPCSSVQVLYLQSLLQSF